jgi:O-acetyl-ADP-ribose deacetylase (regulator of RNase III)
MLKYVVGDLFDTHLPVIIHGCNAQGVMGSGVAKIVHERFPAVYAQYHDYCRKTSDPRNILGTWMAVQTYRYTVINAITQEGFGPGVKQVSYDAVDNIFCDLNDIMNGQGIRGLALPKIGAGLGGGDWGVIERIINHRFYNVPAICYVMNESELPEGAELYEPANV